MLSPDGCAQAGACPSLSQLWTVLRSAPSSAEMRVIVAPTSRSRAASSYRACRRRREAALADWAAVGIGVEGIGDMGGGT